MAAYQIGYGGIVDEKVDTFRVHVSVWGDNRCSFIKQEDKDKPEGTFNYYSDINFTIIATPFEINGETQNYQCVYPYSVDENGKIVPRKDFYFRSSFVQRNKNIFMSGFYSSAYTGVVDLKGQGLVVVDSLVTPTQSSYANRVYEGIVFNSLTTGFLNEELYVGIIKCFTKDTLTIAPLLDRGAGAATCRLERSIIPVDCDLIVTNRAGELYSLVNTIAFSKNIPFISISSTTPTRRSNFNDSVRNTLSSNVEYCNTGVDYSSVGVGNISLDALYNSSIINDFTIKVSSPHFRNGGLNMSANIGDARFGIALYKGDAPHDSGTVSDVVNVDQLAAWVSGANTHYTTAITNINLESIKWIGAENISTNFGAIDSNLQMTSASCGVDFSRKSGTPLCYVRVSKSGQTFDNLQIIADNDLPPILDNITTENFFPYHLSSGASYTETILYIDNTGKIIYTSTQIESRTETNIENLQAVTLTELLSDQEYLNLQIEILVYYSNLVNFNDFQGVTLVAKQGVINEIEIDNNKEQYPSQAQLKLSESIDGFTTPISSLKENLTGLTIPFGFTNSDIELKAFIDANLQAEGQNFEILNEEIDLNKTN